MQDYICTFVTGAHNLQHKKVNMEGGMLVFKCQKFDRLSNNFKRLLIAICSERIHPSFWIRMKNEQDLFQVD